MAGWAVLCGALASNRLPWEGDALLTLLLVLLLVGLAWGSLWKLATGTDWRKPLAEGWPPAGGVTLPSLPYTQSGSPAGRLFRALSLLVGWWREALWPLAGSALLGLVGATALAVALSLLLPGRLRPLYAALVALIGLGVAWRWKGKSLLLGQALVLVGLSWLAGHSTFAEMGVPSLVLALSFALAAWGALRVARRRPGGLWLVNGSQVIAVALLVIVEQPLAAGGVGLLLAGQVAMQLPLLSGGGGEAACGAFARRTWPWLMVAMLVAALVLP